MANFFDILSGSAAAAQSQQAGQALAQGNRKAAKELTAYGNTLPDIYGNIAGAYDPYVQGGGQAYNAALTGLGLAGDPQQQAAFAQNFANTPGYQFAFDQGNQALQRQQQAGPGGGAGGRAMKEAIRYGQGFADTRFQDYLRTLLGLGQQGQAAVGSRAGIQSAAYPLQLQTRTSAYQGNLAANQALAQSQIAAAQAQQQGIGNLVNTGASLIGSALGGPIGGQVGGYLFGGSGSGAPQYNNPYGGVSNPTYY